MMHVPAGACVHYSFLKGGFAESQIHRFDQRTKKQDLSGPNVTENACCQSARTDPDDTP